MSRITKCSGRAVGFLLAIAAVGCIPEPEADVSNPLVLPNGGRSYIANVLHHGRIMRFTRNTITYSLDTDNVPYGWRSDYAGYVVDALSQWEAAANGAFQFQYVESKGNIRFSWVSYIPNEPTSVVGQTSALTDNVTFDPQRVTLAIANLDDFTIYISTLHEIGHALGMDGHSPNAGDLMSPTEGRLDLSPNDVATLLDLYSRPAQITESF